MPKLIDISGRRYNELTVIGLAAGVKLKNRPAWLCVCDCGETRICAGDSLKSGGVTSCGKHSTQKFRDAVAKSNNRVRRQYPPGTDTHSRIYTLWRAMLYRCTNPAHEAYERYGGRGIAVCSEWLEFAGFRSWALSSGYSDHLTIDRIDNDKGYEPGNCRWATTKEQARNRRSNVYLTGFGETKLMVEWASDPRSKVNRALLCKRINAGHPLEFALTASETEVRRQGRVHMMQRRNAARGISTND